MNNATGNIYVQVFVCVCTSVLFVYLKSEIARLSGNSVELLRNF